MGSKRPRSSEAAKVLVVDDHPVVRRGFAQLIDQTHDLEVCAEADGLKEAVAAIAEHDPDVVVADLSLGGQSGLELVEEIRAHHPKLPVLVLSMHDEALYAERALRAGARGYIMKEKPIGEVMEAIRCVLRGEIYLSDKMSARLLQKMVAGSTESNNSLVDTLSNRELQVFELIGRGLGTREIARQLHLSVKTIDTHRENIKRKLNLANTIELHQHAFLWAQRAGVGKLPSEG